MSRAVFALLIGLALQANAEAQTLKDTTPHISVTGEAVEEDVPDQATLLLGVVTERPTAAEAASENARKTQSLMDELAAQGVTAKDIRTEAFTLAPVVTEEPNPRGAPAGKRVSKSFRARNELSVLVKPIEKVSVIAQRSSDSGANEIRGVTFAMSDETARLERLRGLAIKDAERRARTYVEAIGVKLGRVIEISPEADAPPDRMQVRTTSVAVGQALPDESLLLRPGMQKLGSRVTVTWALTH
jgi:uncharacterized protein